MDKSERKGMTFMIRKRLLPVAVALLAVAAAGCSKNGPGNTVVSQLPASSAASVSQSSANSTDSSSESSAAGTRMEELSFPEGKGETDADRTLKSITKVDEIDNFYLMTYYGNYDNIVYKANSTSDESPVGCTLLSMTGNKEHPIFGRNFDNSAGAGAVLARYQPENRYKSLVFSRMSDLGMYSGFDSSKLTESQKKSILNAPYYAADGINEKGLAVALAYNPPGVSIENVKGEKVFITQLMRKILDNAANVDEAIDICRGSRAYDFGADTLTHHFLIADSQANAVTVEFSNGSWQFMRSDVPYQAVTNVPLYNVAEEQRKANCGRYNTAVTMMSGMKGKGGWKDMLRVLEAVKQTQYAQTIWSYSVDMSTRTMYICMNGDFSKIYKVSLS
jgi:hypothetical protein